MYTCYLILDVTGSLGNNEFCFWKSFHLWRIRDPFPSSSPVRCEQTAQLLNLSCCCCLPLLLINRPVHFNEKAWLPFIIYELCWSTHSCVSQRNNDPGSTLKELLNQKVSTRYICVCVSLSHFLLFEVRNKHPSSSIWSLSEDSNNGASSSFCFTGVIHMFQGSPQ